MRNILQILFLVFIPMFMFGQQYSVIQVKNRADSILLNYTGLELFQYFKFETYSLYCLKEPGFEGFTYFEELEKSKKKFSKTNFFYKMVLPYKKCPLPEMDTIYAHIRIDLDSNLNLLNTLNRNDIPIFVWENDSCRLITNEAALSIALKKISKGIKTPWADIKFNDNSGKYFWEIYNVLTENIDGYSNPHGELEIITIDAITGKILDKYKTSYGPAY